MRRLLSWAICSALCMQSAIVVAQQYSPIQPNFGRSARRTATLPSPGQTLTVGTGVSETVIPQQGSVDLGSSTPAPAAVPSYSYTDPMSTAAAPCATGNCNGGGYNLGQACSDCGKTSCLGGCKLGHLSKLFGNKHHGDACGESHGWFGGAYYLHLWRSDDSYGHPLAFDTANPTTTVLGTGFARMEDSSGVGIRIGKMINACSAVEFIYWQVFPEDVTAAAQQSFVGAPISSAIDFNSLTYDNFGGGGAVPVNDFFQDSQYISVTRSFDYSNFEINFLRLPFLCGGNPCSRAKVALLAGARYFRASEELQLFSDDLNEIRGDDPANELKLHDETDNDLVGFQLGCLFDYQFTCRLSGQIGSKVGIYNNHMRHTQSVAGGAGGALIGAGPYAGQFAAVDTKKDDVAFLSEIDAGLAFCVSSNWRLTGGYKVLGISGYADPMNQIPRSFDDLSAAGLIHNDCSLILHGAYLGAEYCW